VFGDFARLLDGNVPVSAYSNAVSLDLYRMCRWQFLDPAKQRVRCEDIPVPQVISQHPGVHLLSNARNLKQRFDFRCARKPLLITVIIEGLYADAIAGSEHALHLTVAASSSCEVIAPRAAAAGELYR
jgi:hypothetical protein